MPNRGKFRAFHWGAVALLAGCMASALAAEQAPVRPTAAAAAGQTGNPEPYRALVNSHCLTCHSSKAKAGGLALDSINTEDLGGHWPEWEKVARKLRARQMPPVGSRRPDEPEYVAALSSLETSLDGLAAKAPSPGRTETFRRLNRTEYNNAIRDLLDLDFDATPLLPSDSASFGFDNVTVGTLSPTLLESYVSAAEKISRLAVGGQSLSLGGSTVRIKPDITQEQHIEGLPIGTRGGALVTHEFPLNGEYEITIRLARDRNEHIEGLFESHDVELLLDNERLRLFTIEPIKRDQNQSSSESPSHENLDSHMKVRVPVAAGPHMLGVTFPKKPTLLLETARQPYEAHFNYYRHPRLQPAVYEISIVGPYSPTGAGDTPSRRRIFTCQPSGSARGAARGDAAPRAERASGGQGPPDSREEDACAKRILSTLMRRAYRRPVTDADLKKPFEMYSGVKAQDGFEAGIEMGLSAVLASPEFLFRIERDPATAASGGAYPISDLELASRLSFFLWSSIPDDELLQVAAKGELDKPAVLERQVKRMLADPRSENLVTNFASQWLHLRNLDAMTPDMRLFPDFDDNLRQAFRQETELLVDSVVRENRSVLDLINADYTFVNERLAKHYGIPNVYGSRFRKVTFDQPASPKPGSDTRAEARGGLLRQGSILMVTSYSTRTSPVIRGKWILDNLLGVPPPPPLPNVPALENTKLRKDATVRERLAEHRKNPVCAGCHRLTDPVGFALENYDAVGRWRTMDAGSPIDSTGGLFDGSEFRGVEGLQAAILKHPDLFVTRLSEKLLTFATGRGVEYYDGPAIRKIVHDAEAQNYRFASLVVGIVKSTPFRMRSPAAPQAAQR